MKKNILIVIVMLGLFPGIGWADEFIRLTKVTCIPEFNYLEITSINVNAALFNEKVWKKYQASTSECLIKGKKIIIKEEPYPLSPYGHCGGDQRSTISLIQEGKELAEFPFFHSQCGAINIHIVTFNGNQLSYCTGMGGTECNTQLLTVN